MLVRVLSEGKSRAVVRSLIKNSASAAKTWDAENATTAYMLKATKGEDFIFDLN